MKQILLLIASLLFIGFSILMMFEGFRSEYAMITSLIAYFLILAVIVSLAKKHRIEKRL